MYYKKNINILTICWIDIQSIEIVNNIRNTFIDMVNQSVWMDTISKKKTIDKVSERMIIFSLEKKTYLFGIGSSRSRKYWLSRLFRHR